MKVYLLQDLRNKGKKGDIIEVSDGYGRNFLIPNKIAVLANASILAEKKSKDSAASWHKEQEFLEAKKTAKLLEEKVVEVGAKPGVEGKLFGSVTSKEVADAVKEQYGVEVNKKKIELPEIKQFGTFEFKVKLFAKVTFKMKVFVKEQK